MRTFTYFLAVLVFAFLAVPAAVAGGDRMIDLDQLTVRIIYDNTEPQEGFEADWGFSCVIEGTGKTILFDTGGKGDIFIKNLTAAGVSPSDIDIVVISHKHWDHIGGLGSFLEANGDVKVYVPVSFEPDVKKEIAAGCTELVEVADPLEVLPGVYSTGDMDGPVREQSLALKTDRGAVVITGCAHPGIDRIVAEAAEVVGDDVLCVMGGFHLGRAGEKKLEQIASSFDGSGVKFCGASHCTGDESIAFFARRYGDRYVRLGAGTVITGSELAGH
jgi:7,8-dihydropterin-6-yl-methyl-4-(beta-D-ribofuranosyl)aminobenzene 5'-phosphate synthase